MIDFDRVTEPDISYLVANARPEEIAEVSASLGVDIETAIRDAVSRSAYSYAVLADEHDVLLCITGVIPYSSLGDRAVPWMLSTDNIAQYRRNLLQDTKWMLTQWLKEWRVLENFIDARYTKSLNWAKHVGFTIHPAMPYGVQGLPFHKITIERKD